MSTVLIKQAVEITDALIDEAQFSPLALASKVISENDPRLDELVAILESGMVKLRRCPCVCCEREFEDPRENAVLELLSAGDGLIRLHMCCEDCAND